MILITTKIISSQKGKSPNVQKNIFPMDLSILPVDMSEVSVNVSSMNSSWTLSISKLELVVPNSSSIKTIKIAVPMNINRITAIIETSLTAFFPLGKNVFFLLHLISF